jgi:hypothetical protein
MRRPGARGLDQQRHLAIRGNLKPILFLRRADRQAARPS